MERIFKYQISTLKAFYMVYNTMLQKSQAQSLSKNLNCARKLVGCINKSDKGNGKK